MNGMSAAQRYWDNMEPEYTPEQDIDAGVCALMAQRDSSTVRFSDFLQNAADDLESVMDFEQIIKLLLAIDNGANRHVIEMLARPGIKNLESLAARMLEKEKAS